jgi:hypothetical protein
MNGIWSASYHAHCLKSTKKMRVDQGLAFCLDPEKQFVPWRARQKMGRGQPDEGWPLFCLE